MNPTDIKDQRMTKAEAEVEMIRAILGLHVLHDTVEAVRVLHDQGKPQFERLRGERKP
jgi:hypothetical protein